MKMSDNMGFIIFITLILIVMVAVLVAMLLLWRESEKINYRPEQREQVEVVGKRIREWGDGPELSPSSDYIVAFKFSDGSVKELAVASGASYLNEPKRIYNSFNTGDKGILAYKEIENIEDKYTTEEERYNGRKFISFDKDSGRR